MKAKSLLDAALLTSLCCALVAGGCSTSDHEGDGSGMGGLGGGDSGAGGDGSGGGEGKPPGSIFTGPGLTISVLGVQVSKAGVATVEFTLSDDAGSPLDREGLVTEGAINPSFILSWLGEDENGESKQYTAYTTQKKTVEGEDPTTQSSTDQGGSYESLGLGHYRYTLGTKIDINEERSHLTHTLGVYASHDFGEKTYVGDELFSWVPDGHEVQTVLDVVTDTACSSCHTRLEFHGGSRRGVGMCNLCHTEANSLNPESGNTIDFQVMVHKIHMGSNLPSVQGGDPYYFVGYMGKKADYSGVQYPWDMRDCTKCHAGEQGDRWITRPAQKPCASCHDRTYFGAGDAPNGWVKHTGGPRDDSECSVCHGEDSLEPISKSHYTKFNNPDLPHVTATILGLSHAEVGKQPDLEFAIEIDGEQHDILAQPLDRIRMRIWGPTSDVVLSMLEEVGAANACADPIVRPCIAPSKAGFIYHAATTIPDTAKGTYTVGLDGRYKLDGVNYPFSNPTLEFAITGELTSRREVVSVEKCNSCHEHLGPHSGSYNKIEYCFNCHNPQSYQELDSINPGEEVTLRSMNLKDFIHNLHSTVGYPAPLNDCAQCHVDGSTDLPLADNLLPSTYAEVTCSSSQPDCAGMGGMPNLPVETVMTTPPQSAACVSCHSATSTKVHAETNSSPSGEACATCHGAGKGQDVGVVHALAP